MKIEIDRCQQIIRWWGVYLSCVEIFAGFQVLNVKKGYEGVQELIVQIET